VQNLPIKEAVQSLSNRSTEESSYTLCLLYAAEAIKWRQKSLGRKKTYKYSSSVILTHLRADTDIHHKD